ncbi:MAG: DEAD/DEAH box helicase [Candidatus Dormibacteraeota bacterium]|nr:DEAD/DEAH box helicase [Candidatus Dormibacteraeota bacterium]
MQTFADAGLSTRTLTALSAQEIEIPVPVQVEALPAILRGEDCVIEAPTGSGKTLAYLLPLVEGIGAQRTGPRALIVSPTRELALQIAEVLETLDHGVRLATLYGGVGYATQTNALKKGVDVVIGTPGRLLDMIGKKLLSLSRVEYLVLDEADEMLDAGFAPDVERIIGMTYNPQTVLASATMPEWVERLISKHLQDPVRVKVAATAEDNTLEHGLVQVERANRLRVLGQMLQQLQGTAIVFGRTKHGVHDLARDLRRMGIDCAELQGNLSQNARDRAMAAFRDKRTPVLVATNVAARGLDVSAVTLVVNFELPDTPQWLTHRIGRTARMGEKGWAVTFLSPEDHPRWRKLQHLGAPKLPVLDVDHLLDEGGWRYHEGRPEPAVSESRIQRPTGHNARRGRWQPRRPGRSSTTR